MFALGCLIGRGHEATGDNASSSEMESESEISLRREKEREVSRRGETTSGAALHEDKVGCTAATQRHGKNEKGGTLGNARWRQTQKSSD